MTRYVISGSLYLDSYYGKIIREQLATSNRLCIENPRRGDAEIIIYNARFYKEDIGFNIATCYRILLTNAGRKKLLKQIADLPHNTIIPAYDPFSHSVVAYN